MHQWQRADVILIASGSDFALPAIAREQLVADGVAVRVVSMPSWELFEERETGYQRSVLPDAVTARVTVEEASTLG